MENLADRYQHEASDIAQDLLVRIARGDYRSSNRLPSVRALSATYGVGQRTVGRTYRLLEAMGAVEIRHGRGVFVRDEYSVWAHPLAGDLQVGACVDSEEAAALRMFLRQASVIALGLIMQQVRSGFAGAKWVDTWTDIDRVHIEWSEGPALNDVLVRILPSLDPATGVYSAGVPGLRLSSQTDRSADLQFVAEIAVRVSLRRLSEA